MTRRLEGKIALLTGASRGIGAAVAKRFAQEGAQLILVARDTAALEAVDDEVQRYGPAALLVPFDLNDLPRLQDLAASIAERFGRLDVLVGNAGILGGLSPMTHITPQAWHTIMTTNLHANWHLLRALESLLFASPAARLMFVSSEVAHRPTAYWGAYAVSKAALEMMVKTYALEVDHRGIKVNLIDPGSVRTGMCAEWMPGKDPASLPAPEEITEIFVQLAEDGCPHQGKLMIACRIIPSEEGGSCEHHQNFGRMKAGISSPKPTGV